jgi:hypothetical protein
MVSMMLKISFLWFLIGSFPYSFLHPSVLKDYNYLKTDFVYIIENITNLFLKNLFLDHCYFLFFKNEFFKNVVVPWSPSQH